VGRLLKGEVEDGAQRWPAALRPALGLRGFRQELRDLLLRAQERGVGPERLRALGLERGREDWVAAAGFLQSYENRFDLDPSVEVLDYAGLVRTAAALLESDDELRARERAARLVVFVDEYQDTDPAQVRLLQALAGDGRDLVAVGDPDQSIYGFRGSDVRGVLEFRDAFRTTSGEPAALVALRTCRRSGADLLADLTAHALRAAMARPELAGTYHAVASGETSWHGYAKHVIEFARAAGQAIKVAPEAIHAVPTSAFPTPAKRPGNSRMNTHKLQHTFGLALPRWQNGVDRMLTEVLERSDSKLAKLS
jgi:hypothetical protein